MIMFNYSNTHFAVDVVKELLDLGFSDIIKRSAANEINSSSSRAGFDPLHM